MSSDPVVVHFGHLPARLVHDYREVTPGKLKRPYIVTVFGAVLSVGKHAGIGSLNSYISFALSILEYFILQVGDRSAASIEVQALELQLPTHFAVYLARASPYLSHSY